LTFTKIHDIIIIERERKETLIKVLNIKRNEIINI